MPGNSDSSKNAECDKVLRPHCRKDLKIKYVITLDSDTELTLNSGFELIEAMAHPLNKPVVKEGIVAEGHRTNAA